MKIKTETVYILEENDLQDILKGLPKDPCKECGSNFARACCGCDKELQYNKIVNEYKQRNIFDHTLLVAKYKENAQNIKELNKQQDIIAQKLLSNLNLNIDEVLEHENE